MGAIVAFLALVAIYLFVSSGKGRADECLGTTDPIERGVMRNTCDHAISVLACPRDPADGDCVLHDAAAKTRFELRGDVAIIAHACRAPYTATESADGDSRECRPVE